MILLVPIYLTCSVIFIANKLVSNIANFYHLLTHGQFEYELHTVEKYSLYFKH